MIFVAKKVRFLLILFSWEGSLIWIALIFGFLFQGVGTARAGYDLSTLSLDLPADEQVCPGEERNFCGEKVAGMEDVLLPDLQTLPPFDFRLVEYRGSGRREIRFANSVWNSGEGVLELQGEYDGQNNTVDIEQHLFGEGQEPLTHGVGEFTFHPEHNHWHWEDFSIYEIWDLAPDGSLGEIVVTSGKVGYCMLDIRRINGEEMEDSSVREARIPDSRQYRGCAWRSQGISVGWVDTYYAHTPGQVMDVSELRDGIYAFRSTVDPEGFLYEADRDNNSAIVYFSLYGNQFRLIGETLSTQCQWQTTMIHSSIHSTSICR